MNDLKLYNGIVKQAYDISDISHPDNATANKVIGALAGGALGGGAGYGISTLLTKNKTIRLLAAILGAGLGGAAGYGTGYAITDKWLPRTSVDDANNRFAQELSTKIKARMQGKSKEERRTIMHDEFRNNPGRAFDTMMKDLGADVKHRSISIDENGNVDIHAGYNTSKGYRLLD